MVECRGIQTQADGVCPFGIPVHADLCLRCKTESHIREMLRRAGEIAAGQRPRRAPREWPVCVYAGTERETQDMGCRRRVRWCKRTLDETPICECVKCEHAGARAARQPTVLYLQWQDFGPLDRVMAQMEGLGWTVHRLERGGGNKAWQRQTIDALNEIKPDWFLTRQRLHRPGSDPLLAELARLGQRTIYADWGMAFGRAQWKSLLFDPIGDNALGSTVGGFDRLLADPVERAAIDAARPAMDAFTGNVWRLAEACTPGILTQCGIGPHVREFWLGVLQMTGDGALAHDGAGAMTPLQLGRSLIVRAKRERRSVVLKCHPRDTVTHALMKHHDPAAGVIVIPPRAMGHVNDRLSAWLCVNAAHIVVVNSTLPYQAMPLGTPITALGKGWYTGNRVIAEQHGARVREIDFGATQPSVWRRRLFMQLLLSRQVDVGENPALEDPGRFVAILERFERFGTDGLPV